MGWEEKDAALRAQGFPRSKLGPGVPAITTTSMFGGATFQDDNGDVIPAGELSEASGRDDTGRRHWRDDDDE